jgi:membrane protease YdiL (CAAX protease family)
VIARVSRPTGSARAELLVRPVAIGLVLALVVGVRWLATVSDGPPFLVGTLFGLGLVGLAFAGGLRWTAPRPRALLVALLVGLAGAVVLVALAIGAGQLAGQPLHQVAKSDFVPWVLVTTLVATAEELVLRGVLFDSIREAGGLTVAVIVTSAVFALMHVPFYGWHVVPLDLGVGVLLAGLRLASGSVAAPAVAHVLADLATWWI